MRALVVARREIRSAFNSPVAYIVAVAYLAFTASWLFFINQFFVQDDASLSLYFNVVPVVLAVLLPALTMRSWAEERRMGTLEVLLTLPIREGEVVVAKFLAVLFLLVLVTAFSLPIPLSLARLGAFDAGQIVAQYIGVLLIGAAGISVGLFISSLATNQVTAFVLGALALVAITLAGQLPRALSLNGWLADVLAYLALSQHYDTFRKGLLDSRDVLYFVLVCALFLFLNLRVLLRRKS